MNFGVAVRGGSQIESDFFPRFYDLTNAGAVFSDGCSATALSANTITTGANTTPILGVQNKLASTVNLVILQASLQIVAAGNSAVAPGAFVWATGFANGGNDETGNQPFGHVVGNIGNSQAVGCLFEL